MKLYFYLLFLLLFLVDCSNNKTSMDEKEVNIIYLHHSTGYGVWRGGANKYVFRLTGKGDIQKLIHKYNKKHNVVYTIKHQVFPKNAPYGWKNYPFDYYNIWVKNAGEDPYMEEPTLEMLTKDYDIIVFKHCFPVSGIQEDTDSADINSEVKTLGNYKLQYAALKEKLHQFPDTKFILWTGAALTKGSTTEESARLAEEFFNWVTGTWDEPGDNIYLWDFRRIEVGDGLYLKDEYASSLGDSHPKPEFNARAAKLFVNRLTDVIENKGTKTSLMGELL
jgi:hypothetical protein